MYIISKCLLGENCKYNGGNNRNEAVIRFCSNHSFYGACPEERGGLPCPRPPAEYCGDRIINCEGKDVTEYFLKGAELEFMSAAAEAGKREEVIEGAILKAKSPSCGKDRIYDGTFSGTLTEGDGAFVRILRKENIKIISEKEIQND